MTDESIYGNHGSFAAETWTEGKIGPAPLFDGVDDYINCGKNASLTLLPPFTLMAWLLRGTKTDANGMIITKDWNYKLLRDTNYKIAFVFRDLDAPAWRNLTSDTAIAAVWTHVALTAEAIGSNTLVKIYLNGALDKSGTLTGQPAAYDVDVIIGANQAGTERFVGVIAEPRMYTRVTEAYEIEALYRATV